MGSRTPIDPRVTAAGLPEPEPGTEAGIRPVVALPRSGPSRALIAAAIAAAAIILFLILDSRRRSEVEPTAEVAASGAPVGGSYMPPPLQIPPAAPTAVMVPVPAQPVPPAAQPRPAPVYITREVPVPQPVPYYPPPPDPATLPPPPQRSSNNPSVVIDTTAPAAAPLPGEVVAQLSGDGEGVAVGRGGGQSGGRVRSGVFANRSTTVPVGTLIPAVLETAFDSRRPGFARAIVSRDVRGFDGTRVLIPRGSRLTGEYRSDIQAGQKRALINWTRLLRPDGVTMAIASPSADTLGRGGVRGDYNSHFLERFGSAILQSALQVGVNVASRAAAGNVIVALPGSTQTSAGSVFEASRIVPTLTVPAGTSMSVFVARDLDFSAADRQR